MRIFPREEGGGVGRATQSRRRRREISIKSSNYLALFVCLCGAVIVTFASGRLA